MNGALLSSREPALVREGLGMGHQPCPRDRHELSIIIATNHTI